MNNYKRKWWQKYLIERGFHSRQLLRLIGLTMISVFLSTIGLWIVYNNIITQFSASDMPFFFSPEDMHMLSDQIPGIRKVILMWVLIMSGLNIILVVFVGIFITRKLGGPLYRFNQIMEKIAEGDLTAVIRLRKGDEFKDLAKNINDAIARLQLMIMVIRENIDAIEAIDPKSSDQEASHQSLSNIQDALSYFKTVETVNPDPRG